MPEGSFNLVYTTGVERESGVQAPHRRGSLKLSTKTPTWSYQVRNTTAHGRGGGFPFRFGAILLTSRRPPILLKSCADFDDTEPPLERGRVMESLVLVGSLGGVLALLLRL